MKLSILPILALLFATEALGSLPTSQLMVENKLFRKSRFLEIKGRPARAAKLLRSGLDSLKDPGHYLAGTLFEDARRKEDARDSFEKTKAHNKLLSGLANWHLSRLESETRTEDWETINSSYSAATLTKVAFDSANRLLEKERLAEAGTLTIQLLSHLGSKHDIARARLLLAKTWIAQNKLEEAEDLLGNMIFFRETNEARTLALKHFPELPADVDQLIEQFKIKKIKTIKKKKRRKKKKVEEPSKFDQAKHLSKRKSNCEEAISMFLEVEEASKDRRTVTASRYFRASCMERTDRDMDALELYESLLDEESMGPASQMIANRIIKICIREKLLDKGLALTKRLLEESLPGSLLPEFYWQRAWLHYLAGDWSNARQSFEELLRFYSRKRSTMEYYGPMALYWMARCTEKMGGDYRSEMAVLAKAIPLDYYGILAKRRLGLDPAVSLPRRPSANPIRLEMADCDESAALPLMLYRLGIYDEALKESMALLERGQIDSCLISLLGSLSLRVRGLHKTRLVRQNLGSSIASPQNGGGLLWLDAFGLEYGAEISAIGEMIQDKAIIAGIIKFESNFKPRAVSWASARGLMQLKYYVAKQVSQVCFGTALRTRNLDKPLTNLKLEAALFAELRDRYLGNYQMALAAYNAGAGKVSEWVERFGEMETDEWVEQMTYPGTRGYLKRIITARAAYYSLFWEELDIAQISWGLSNELVRKARPILDERSVGCWIQREKEK